jgi:hypothetical protein
LVDTDVLVEYLRGNERAVGFLEGLEGELLISAITVAELFSGARDTEERDALEQFLLAFQVVPIAEELAKDAGLLRRKCHASHGVGLADALIAVTAIKESAQLVTFNRRHFPMVQNLKVPYAR